MAPVNPQMFVEPLIRVVMDNIVSAPQLGHDHYLDPGSGSYLLQLLIAALVGSAFVLRTFWSRIKNFFMRNRQDETEERFDE
jgi:hypothetical protein